MVLLIVPLVDLPCLLLLLLWVFTWRQGRRKKQKKNFRKCSFFVVSPLTGLYVRQERRKKRKKHVLENVFFFVVSPLRASLCQAKRRKKRKKHVLQSVVFSWFAHTGLYVTPVGGKQGGKKRKKNVLENAGFSCFAHRGLYVRQERRKNKKNTF